MALCPSVLGCVHGMMAEWRVHVYMHMQTWAGSAGCALASMVVSVALVSRFNTAGFFPQQLPAGRLLKGCAACAVLSAVVESLPLPEVDNLTVPLAAGLLAAYGGVF